MNVLVVHNRYRLTGGEERAVELHTAALEHAGMRSATLIRDSSELSRLQAGASLLRGGDHAGAVAQAVRELSADVVHVHNMHPAFGPRALLAARRAGARVVLHLHNFRLFCSIAVAFRDGAPCFRCRRGLTLPGLALNCRGSLAESAVYTTALAAELPVVLRAVDRFVTLSRYAAGQLIRLGIPAERLEVVPNYIPAGELRAGSEAAAGSYALVAGRLSAEKGVAVAAEAARLAGVPLKVAGDGPLRRQLEAAGGPVELVGPVTPAGVRELLDDAAMALVPSLGGDVMPYAALEAMARGAPIVASRSGSLPELVGPERCVPRGDPAALAEAMRALWDDRKRREREGNALIVRARERYGEDRYVTRLRRLYEQCRRSAM